MSVVKKDILHPAATFRKRVEIGNLVYEATRVHQVTDLADGSADQSATMLARAMDAVGESVGNFHPFQEAANAGCVIRDISARPQTQDDSSALVFLQYWTIIPTFTSGVGIISVERDSALTVVESDLHPNGLQIVVSAEGNLADTQARSALRPRSTPIRKIVITAAVTPRNLDAIESAVRSVNDDTWFGLPAGYWRFDRLRDTQQTGSATMVVVAEFSSMNMTWMDFASLSLLTGGLAKVSNSVVLKALSDPYVYGVRAYKGLTAIGWYPMISFASMFGITKWPA